VNFCNALEIKEYLNLNQHDIDDNGSNPVDLMLMVQVSDLNHPDIRRTLFGIFARPHQNSINRFDPSPH